MDEKTQLTEPIIYKLMDQIDASWRRARFKASTKEWDDVVFEITEMRIDLRQIRNYIHGLPGHEPPCAPETIQRRRLEEALKQRQQQQ